MSVSPANVTAKFTDGTLINAVRSFVKLCPYLPEYRKQINVNYLGGEVDEFAIETIPSDPIEKRYVTGDSIRVLKFYFESREQYTKDVLENLTASGFYELFADWLEECTKQGALPELSSGRNCLSITADTQGYIMDAQNTKASYVIQCTMRYFQQY